MNDSDHMESESRCSYCGNWIYEDLIRCPKCGNYTDGLGKFSESDDPHVGRPSGERRLPQIFVIAGWLVLICMLLPLLLALYNLVRR
jgi:hypothetical protein